MVKNIRIGCIVPAINTAAEDDFIALCPPDVGVHFARADVDQTRPMAEQFQRMVDDAPYLATTLVKADVKVVGFACTSASFFKGEGSDSVIAENISDKAGVPAVTTSTAVVEALRKLGARRVAVATPYLQWVYEAEKEFLHAAGFEVTAINGMERRGGADIHTISEDEIRNLVADVDSAQADAIFVSCTDLPALSLIDEIEDRHGKSVVTSNQATFWGCAKAAGVPPIQGYGRLLRDHL